MIFSANPTAGAIVVLVRSWPRLSQTFVLDEILRLQRAGVPVRVVALATADDEKQQAELDELTAPVRYLDGAASRWRIVTEHLHALRRFGGGYLRAYGYALRHREWDRGYHVAGRMRCLTLAVRLAGLLREPSGPTEQGPVHLHAHFAHDPAAVALLTHVMTGVPWSFTGHARDIWQVPPQALAERVRSATFCVSCSTDGYDELRRIAAPEQRDRVTLVHHGVDVEAFHPVQGRPATAPPTCIVSIGRLIEKKGFVDLVDACKTLADAGHDFRATIYGDGPLRRDIAARITTLGLSGVIELAGPRTRRELLRHLQGADVFALTPHVTADGDRDGIPNSLLEAMACGLPIVATDVAGVPEAIRDGVDGLLAPPRDPAGIAARIALLLGDPDLRARLGAAARRTALERFDSRIATRELAGLFTRALAVGRSEIAAGVR